ncbi:hypothetical protein C3D70_13105 [Cronobacter sakazakii]|nr:hypothetical protein C3D70_13105 [Cronobacter sakazakii]
MLQYFLATPQQWDEKALFNIEHASDRFLNMLLSPSTDKFHLDTIFGYCFRFALEKLFFFDDDNNRLNLVSQIKNFGIYKYSEFEGFVQIQIDFALKEMPMEMTKYFLKSDDVKSYRDFVHCLAEGKNFTSQWEQYLKKQHEAIDDIHKTLQGYESAFNFVGLYDGFNQLGKQKRAEIRWSRCLLLLLAIIIPAPILYQYFHMPLTDVTQGAIDKLIIFIPFISLTFILIYFFRVALSGYNSLRAQIVQIELRKSLCQFIQSYSKFSLEIREANVDALKKFEEVVFSNIMPSDDKIPSTFDGLEQIASLINSVKPR